MMKKLLSLFEFSSALRPNVEIGIKTLYPCFSQAAANTSSI